MHTSIASSLARSCVMMALVHDIAEADVGDITPEQHSGVSKAQKLELEAVSRPKPACSVTGQPGSLTFLMVCLFAASDEPDCQAVGAPELVELAGDGAVGGVRGEGVSMRSGPLGPSARTQRADVRQPQNARVQVRQGPRSV